MSSVRSPSAGSSATCGARASQAVAVVEAAGLRQEYVAPAYPWLATVLRRQVEALPQYAGPGRRRKAIAGARRATRRAVRLARSYRNNAPHALREHALV